MIFLKFLKRNEKQIKTVMLVVFFVLIAFLIFRISFYNIFSSFWQSSLFLSFKKFLNGFFLLYLAFVAFVIFFERRDPSATLAWLLVLIFMPIVGFAFYILFGRNIRKKIKNVPANDKINKIAEKQMGEMHNVPKEYKNSSVLIKSLAQLLLNNAKAPLGANNRVSVLTNGFNTYQSMLDAIESAEDHIHFEFFIIRDDDIGNQFKEALMEKAQAGVTVRVIYDSVGCWKLGEEYIESLKAAGVEVYPFAPVIFPLLSRELNYRNHRKIIVIDGRIGFLGGLNIGDEYLGKNKTLGFWRDTHLRIVGESVYSLQKIFLNDWADVSEEIVDGKKYYPTIEVLEEKQFVQIASSGPTSDWQCILKAYFNMIAKAEKKIWITTPYLVPEESLRTGLITAALSGIDVRIIIPNKPDHFFVYWASRDNIESLLKAGVKVYTYEKGFVHSKSILVDGEVASVGTANFDYRSLEINYEVNAFIYNKKSVKRLEEDYLTDLEASKLIKLEEHLTRSIFEKGLESLGRLVSPLQ